MKRIACVLLFPLFISVMSCAQGNSKKIRSQIFPQTRKLEVVVMAVKQFTIVPVRFEFLNWIDTLPDFKEKGPKMVINGTIYLKDGKTPAAGVVLYVYHTDQTGHYTPEPGQPETSRRHGYIQGWIRTNEKGQYRFYTLKPAPYPNAKIPPIYTRF